MFVFFFFNDTATTEIYTLSLHDALPISAEAVLEQRIVKVTNRVTLQGTLFNGLRASRPLDTGVNVEDRKSTRLNSSHANISYAVFCLKKKKNIKLIPLTSL